MEELQNYQKIITESSGRVYFEGILCTLDQPSEKSPTGARGHQIILTSFAAERAISGLIGAPVNYTENWQGHDIFTTIGLISKAFTENQKLKVRGYLLTAKYPKIIDQIKSLEESLGMSYELRDARVEDMRKPVWTLTRVNFTGVAILLQNKAAYRTSTFHLLDQ